MSPCLPAAAPPTPKQSQAAPGTTVPPLMIRCRRRNLLCVDGRGAAARTHLPAGRRAEEPFTSDYRQKTDDRYLRQSHRTSPARLLTPALVSCGLQHSSGRLTALCDLVTFAGLMTLTYGRCFSRRLISVSKHQAKNPTRMVRSLGVAFGRPQAHEAALTLAAAGLASKGGVPLRGNTEGKKKMRRNSGSSSSSRVGVGRGRGGGAGIAEKWERYTRIQAGIPREVIEWKLPHTDPCEFGEGRERCCAHDSSPVVHISVSAAQRLLPWIQGQRPALVVSEHPLVSQQSVVVPHPKSAPRAILT